MKQLYRERGSKVNIEEFANPFTYSPEIGSLFSARVEKDYGKRDYIITALQNWTGYIKNSKYINYSEIKEGDYYRFIVTAVHSKNFHNYYYALPFRKLGRFESRNLNYIPPEKFLKIKRTAEKLVQKIPTSLKEQNYKIFKNTKLSF